MAKAIGLSPYTLKRYRLSGLLVEDIHWIRLNPRCIRYNQELVQDWVAHRQDPQAHLRAIEVYYNNLLGNQRIRLPRRQRT